MISLRGLSEGAAWVLNECLMARAGAARKSREINGSNHQAQALCHDVGLISLYFVFANGLFFTSVFLLFLRG